MKQSFSLPVNKAMQIQFLINQILKESSNIDFIDNIAKSYQIISTLKISGYLAAISQKQFLQITLLSLLSTNLKMEFLSYLSTDSKTMNYLSQSDSLRVYTRKVMSGSQIESCFSYISTKTMRTCLLYTSPSPRDLSTSRMPSSA